MWPKQPVCDHFYFKLQPSRIETQTSLRKTACAGEENYTEAVHPFFPSNLL